MSKRFGPKSFEDYYSKEDQLHDWAMNCGYGMMGITMDAIPADCVDFCLSQYERYNVPIPRCIYSIIEQGAWVSLFHADVGDPYCLFHGVSDVNYTYDWVNHAFEVLEEGNKIWEPEPNSIETFTYIPGQAEETFNYITSHPGLDALPNMIGDYLSGAIRGISDFCWYNQEEPVWTQLHGEEILELRSMCIGSDGNFDERRFLAYFDLAAWAAFAWIAGPLSSAFRMRHHEIMSVAMSYGECLFADGVVIAPSNYQKLSRPPQSCYKCGIAGWCVEIVLAEDYEGYICEHCSSIGMPRPPSSLANCGSKMCMYSECPHNPYHGFGAAGIHRAHAQYGQLGAMVRENVHPEQPERRRLK